jgi:hypothetical protein
VILPNTCCDQCFVFKLSPEGNPIWGTLAGGADDDQGLDIIGDTQGNTYVTGFTNANGSIAFGNNLTITTHNIGTNIYNYFAAKLDQSGVWQWATTFGNLPWDEPTNKYLERDIAISIDDSSNIYIAGGFDGTRNFGTKTLTAAGGTDIFLTKISSAGDIKWAIAGGSHKDDWANGVSADNLGNVYVTGEHRDSLFFGQTLVQNFKKRDAFIAKFDTQNGRCLWGKHAGNDEGNERGNDVFADKNCNVYVTGEVGGNATFGNILVENEGNPQIFVAKISTEGDWIWAATAGSSDTFDIRSNSIAMAQNDEIYITGNFRNTAIFGSNTLASNGKTDVFLAKINDFKLKNNCTIERKTLARAINIYPNPATSFINIAYFANKKENMDIKIIDITGRAVAHWTVTATNGQNNIERDLPILPTAIYYVYITTESIFSIQKLFIQQ